MPITDKLKAAYRRGDLFAKRPQELKEALGACYCEDAEVIDFPVEVRAGVAQVPLGTRVDRRWPASVQIYRA